MGFDAEGAHGGVDVAPHVLDPVGDGGEAAVCFAGEEDGVGPGAKGVGFDVAAGLGLVGLTHFGGGLVGWKGGWLRVT